MGLGAWVIPVLIHTQVLSILKRELYRGIPSSIDGIGAKMESAQTHKSYTNCHMQLHTGQNPNI